MTITLRAAVALAALALAGTSSAAIRDHPNVGKPSATSPPAAFSTTGPAESGFNAAGTGKPTATSPPAWRSTGKTTMVAIAAMPVVPGPVGKPSATSPPRA